MKNRIFVIFIFITHLIVGQNKDCIQQREMLSTYIDNQIKTNWKQDSNQLKIIDYTVLPTRNDNLQQIELSGSSRVYTYHEEKVKLLYQETKKENIDSGFKLTKTEITIYFAFI